MYIENLKLHYNLVRNENYQTTTCWAIVESSKDFNRPLKIDEYLVLYPLDYLTIPSEFDEGDSDILDPIIERFKHYQQIEGKFGKHYYLLEYALISPNRREGEVRISGLGIPYILDDLLNILCLYYNRYFIIFPYNNFIDFSIIENYKTRILDPTKDLGDIEDSSANITQNFNILCQLRQEQFYLIERSMKQYSNSLYAYETNPSIALCFLMSSIEILAQRYTELSENWEDYAYMGFYRGLKKDLDKIKDDSFKGELFERIGKRFIKETYQLGVRVKEFLFKFCDNDFHLLEDSNDKHFKELIKDYYEVRSKYMHDGTEIITSNHNRSLIYNRTNKGKLKIYETGTILDVKILPSFQTLIILIKGAILNFLNSLYQQREEEQDKKRYKQIDLQKRGIFTITANRDLLPGTVVAGSDVYRKEQYIDLYKRYQRIKIYNEAKNYTLLIDEFTKIKEKLKESEDYNRLAICNNSLATFFLNNEEIEKVLPVLSEAKEICEERDLNDIKYSVDYNFACYYSRKMDLANASESLRNAFGDLRLRDLARDDEDLRSLREDPKYRSLFE